MGDNLNDQAVEWRHEDSGSWKPIAQSSRSDISQTEGNLVIDRANGKVSFHFDFPELLDYVGLPTSIFVSLQLMFEPIIDESGTPTNAFVNTPDWDMTIDVSGLLTDASVQPQAITIHPTLAYLGCWIFGICKPSDIPRIKLEVSTFWNTAWAGNPLAAPQSGEAVTEAIVDVQRIRDVESVASACRTCGHRPANVQVFHLTNSREGEPVVRGLKRDTADATVQAEAHRPAGEAKGASLWDWVKL